MVEVSDKTCECGSNITDSQHGMGGVYTYCLGCDKVVEFHPDHEWDKKEEKAENDG